MDRRGRALKLTTVAALVVLALTGFTEGRGGRGGGHGGSGGGGGGCSSSGQDHDSSSSGSSGSSGYAGSSGYGSTSGSSGYRDSDDDDLGGGTSGGSTRAPSAKPTPRPATVKLVSCATSQRPYATVEVTNPNDAGHAFDVFVRFMEADSWVIDSAFPTVKVAARSTKTVRVPFGGAGPGEKLDHCQVDDTADPAS